MRHVGRSRHIGRTALSRLIAEESALDAVHHSRPDRSANGLIPSERTVYDDSEHFRHGCDVGEYDKESQQEVSHRHDRDDDTADLCNPLDSPEYDDKREDGDDDAHHDVVPSESMLHGVADGVALNRVVGKSERDCDEDGKEPCHPFGMQSFINVVCRSADERVLILPFVELGERGLDKGRSRSHERDDPHPEASPRPSDGDGRGHARHVASAHTCGQGDGKCLERCDMLLFRFFWIIVLL